MAFVSAIVGALIGNFVADVLEAMGGLTACATWFGEDIARGRVL